MSECRARVIGCAACDLWGSVETSVHLACLRAQCAMYHCVDHVQALPVQVWLVSPWGVWGDETARYGLSPVRELWPAPVKDCETSDRFLLLVLLLIIC